MTGILREGETCWRIAPASRITPLIDGAAYFAALRAACERAQRRIILLGWDLRSGISLDPTGSGEPLAAFLDRLARERPALDVHILVWDWLFLFALDRETLPGIAFGLRTHRRVHFVLDDAHPPGAAHHEKVVVIDGSLAFVGGLDLTAGRYDTPDHPPRCAARDGAGEPRPFHDLALMVEGPIAAALDELARQRWERATAERLPALDGLDSPWPDEVAAWLTDRPLAVLRTRHAAEAGRPVREIARCYEAAIGAARRAIYIENQYLTVPAIATALAERLRSVPELELLIITPARCEGILETMVMDVGRARFIERLRAAADEARCRTLVPEVANGAGWLDVNVHAKLLIVDDRFLTLGSANIANRSMGLDSETNLALELAAADTAGRAALAGLRARLLGEHLGRPAEAVARELRAGGGLIAATQHAGPGRRLTPLVLADSELPDGLRQATAIADADEPVDAARLAGLLGPPRRRRRLALRLAAGALVVLGAGLLTLLIGGSDGAAAAWAERLLATAAQWRFTGLDLLVTALVFTLGSLVLVPVTLMILVTGGALGALAGIPAALCGVVAAAVATFLLGRTLGREAVRRIAGRPANGLARKLARHGVLTVALIRLVPIAPFTVVNLVAGVSELRLTQFTLGTLLGMAPGIVVIIALGDRMAAFLREPGPLGLVILVLVIAVGVAAALLARRLLRRHAAE